MICVIKTSQSILNVPMQTIFYTKALSIGQLSRHTGPGLQHVHSAMTPPSTGTHLTVFITYVIVEGR